MEECSGTSAGTCQTDDKLALPGSSASTSSSIIPRRDLLDGTFFKYLPQESTAHDVTALCSMCLPMSVKIKGPDEFSINFTGHLKRKHGDHCLAQYKKFIKRKKDDVEYKKIYKNNEVRKISDDQLKQNILQYIINTMIPLEYVDNPYFFSFLENINVPKKYLETMCYEKFERYLDEEFESQMNEIKSKIIKASFVCTSCDVWKRRDKQYLSATAHWFTEDLNRVSVALSCREYNGIPSYYDVKQYLDPIFEEFALGADIDRASAVFIEDSRVIVRAFNAYGVNNKSIDCKDPSSILEFLTEPAINTESTGSLLIWVKEHLDDDYYAMPDIIDCPGRTLMLTATVDFIHILNKSPDDLFIIHEAAINKCNNLWTAGSFKHTSQLIVNVLGHNLIRPNANRWNSLYDAFRQILALKLKNKELHAALGFTNIITDEEFKYIEELLRCSMPVAEAVDILMSTANNYYGTVLPCVTDLQTKLKNMEEKCDMVYCNTLVSGLRQSVESRFKDLIELNSVVAEHAAIAAISCPRFKKKWLTRTDYKKRFGILNVFEALITREIIAERGQTETLDDIVGLKTEDDEIVDLTTSSKPLVISQSEIKMNRYFADKSEDLDMLDRHPEIKKIFFEFNAPLASAVIVNTIFDSEQFMGLKRTGEIEQEVLFKRVIMKYNIDSMKYLRRNN